jgi:cell division protein ZapA (FtsZ GTPase activity inhibitor)
MNQMPNPKEEKQPKKGVITLEDLAVMVGRGFAATATKADLSALKHELTEEMSQLDKRITDLDRKMEAGFQDIMHELTPLKEKVPHLEADNVEHERRIKALERHAGIRKE